MGWVTCLFFAAALAAPWLFKVLGRNTFLLLAAVPATGFGLSLATLPGLIAGRAPWEQDLHWLPDLGLSGVLRMDALSCIMSLVVTGVGALVFVYCSRYFERGDPTLGRFGAIFTAFAGMMYGLVLADELFTLFLFWEGTTIFSYLLVGHNSGRQAARRAALQALIVTTAGGLAMLGGMLILQFAYGTGRISQIVEAGYSPAHVPGAVIPAILLILIGAVSKSALLPFHFWLPGAMAAPTPVSAYLHAAAMVKAGVYLVLRLAPGFAAMPGWKLMLITLGIITVLVGGYQALRQYDLKSILAYGTVSQLGLLVVIACFGTPATTQAALAMLVSHALFKSVLFLVSGVIDHHAGTRDIRKLCGFARADPILVITAVIAAASMSGIPPLFGFVAKEGVYATLLDHGDKSGLIALAGIVVGSALTIGYAWRFVFGAFGNKHGVEPVAQARTSPLLAASPVILSAAIVVAGLFPRPLDTLLALHSGAVGSLPANASVSAADNGAYHLALWHGWETALALSALTVAAGVLLCVFAKPVSLFQAAASNDIDLSRAYRRTVQALEDLAAYVTGKTQRGSLPFYQAVIYIAAIAALTVSLLENDTWPAHLRLADSWQQIALAAVMIPAAVAACTAQKRFAAVVIVGVTGYGMVAFFAFQGAPDLALTQVLVESITLVVFVLVLRRLPSAIGSSGSRFNPAIRLGIGVAFGVLMMVLVAVALGARQDAPVSETWGELAYHLGHGRNIVNVALVDLRAWDTMGELSVVVVAATGVASLIFVRSREGKLQRLPDLPSDRAFAQANLARSGALDADDPHGARIERNDWLLAGRTLAPANRSIVLEVVVRMIFHALIVLSLYLLFAGHNLPGGGFAAGLVAGLALIARYLAGGRYELAEAVRVDAGRLLGAGLALVALVALGGFIWGDTVLDSVYLEADVPVLGHLSFGTATLFDIGVYLVVVGMMLDVLRAIGVQVDLHQEQDERALAKSLEPTPIDQTDQRQVHAILGRLDDYNVDGRGGSL